MKQKPSYNDIEDKAKSYGAETTAVINWSWSTGFNSPVDAERFIAWLNTNGIEHRGYYPADPKSNNPNFHEDGVRWRR